MQTDTSVGGVECGCKDKEISQRVVWKWLRDDTRSTTRPWIPYVDTCSVRTEIPRVLDFLLGLLSLVVSARFTVSRCLTSPIPHHPPSALS